MGLFDAKDAKKESSPRRRESVDTPSRAEQLAEAQALVEAEKAEAAFRASPVGRASAAREAGQTFLELRIDVTDESAVALADVEAVGWRLEHAGYAYVGPTDTIVGIYLFRSTD